MALAALAACAPARPVADPLARLYSTPPRLPPPNAAVKDVAAALKLAKALCSTAPPDTAWIVEFHFPFWDVAGGESIFKDVPTCRKFSVRIYAYDGSARPCAPCDVEV